MTNLELLNKMLYEDKYYNNLDIRYNKNFNILLSNNELDTFLDFKDNYECNLKSVLPLYTFNSNKIYYFMSEELLGKINDYYEFIHNDYGNNINIINDNYNEILLSRVTSELDGTLRIEGVNTTRKQVLSIINNNDINDNNDQIIYNMVQGFRFIKDKPMFNKDNLRRLFNILSYKSLDNNLMNDYYRKIDVLIGNHTGCPINDINNAMDSLFNYVNNNLNNEDSYLLPFIVHYYLLYIHPYPDYNGRTARMASLWISMLIGENRFLPTFISEAINDNKTDYYKYIDYSRNSHNDLTYFITFLFNLSNKYYMLYKNIEHIKELLVLQGENLTVTETYYLKRILANSHLGWFNVHGFIKFSHLDITKQAGFKILNRFLDYNLLISKTNSKNEKVFLVNEKIIKYQYK